MRLGGDFEIDTSLLQKKDVTDFEFLPKHFKLWVDLGRSAIYLALKLIIIRGGSKKALLPAFVCPSVIEPFILLGFEIRYYGLNQSFEEINIDNGETIFFVHYFGKNNYRVVEWIDKLRLELDIFVIEDCVQSSLNKNIGNIGDFSIISLRKFLPLPDGAILASKHMIPFLDTGLPHEEFISKKILGKFLRGISNNDQEFLVILSDAEKLLEGFIPRRMSTFSTYLLSNINFSEIARLRRENWKYLYKNLNYLNLFEKIVPVFSDLSEDEVPLGFPVKILGKNRERLRNYLFTKNIFCAIHWELDHIGEANTAYNYDLQLSREILTFPIDQRVTFSHIDYLLQSILQFFEEKNYL